MTAALIISLTCDAPHCERETIATHGQPVSELLHVAGWGRVGQKHYCDHHYPDVLAGRPFGAPSEDVF